MSYELCNSITIDRKNNVLKIKHCSNNVYPKDYYTTELWMNNTLEQKIEKLLDCLLSGDIVISSVNKNTIDVYYALEKLLEDNKIVDKWDDKGVSEEYTKEIKGLAKKFNTLIAEKKQGDYILSNGFSFITRLCKYSKNYNNWLGCYTTLDRDRALKLDYKMAYLVNKKVCKSYELFEA